MYKLSYYGFGDLYTDAGRSGYDRVRQTEIGDKHVTLSRLEEAYTTEHSVRSSCDREVTKF